MHGSTGQLVMSLFVIALGALWASRPRAAAAPSLKTRADPTGLGAIAAGAFDRMLRMHSPQRALARARISR